MKTTLLAIITLTFCAQFVFGQTQPPNIDFENWETITGPIGNTYEEPVDWSSSNECTELINSFAVTKTTDAYSGTHAVRFETLPAFGNIKINGVLTTANMICTANGGGQEGGIDYTEEPDSLVGWYKYAPANNDSAYSQIMFLANNDMDTVSFTRLDLHAAADWTRFSTPINSVGVGQTAEKLSLLFSSSWGDGSQGQAEVGSIMFLDDISFVFNPAGIGDNISRDLWNVYPNPVVNKLNVKIAPGQQANIEIFDVTGKRIVLQKVNEMKSQVNVDQIVTGIYLYQLTSLEGGVIKTGKLLINP